MKGKSVLKVEKGKLIKTFLDYNGKINEIKITGDFFVHPEEGIEMLEKELVGKELDRNVLLEKIDNFFRKNEIKLFGIDPESLVTAIMNCTEEGK
jgi:lipoate-protein ligase A